MAAVEGPQREDEPSGVGINWVLFSAQGSMVMSGMGPEKLSGGCGIGPWICGEGLKFGTVPKSKPSMFGVSDSMNSSRESNAVVAGVNSRGVG